MSSEDSGAGSPHAPEISDELREAEEVFEALSPARQPWALLLLKAIDAEGGETSPKAAARRAWEIAGDQLSESQVEYLEKNQRLGWVKFSLKSRGFIVGGRGVWKLSELARAWVDAHRADLVVLPDDIPNLSSENAQVETAGTESVLVTGQPAYFIPILDALSGAPADRQELLARVHERMGPRLLPGDERRMKRGSIVWRYRAPWAVTSLKSRGLVRSSGGRWEITDAGRSHLERERGAWETTDLPTGKATVVSDSAPPLPPDSPAPVSGWDSGRWSKLQKQVSAHVHGALSQRLRPELGPSPDTAVPRNVILYGPPGTGKTWIATAVARALTAEPEPGPDSRWRLVQFHPSYAYEDFIQGLRPDLEQSQLHYKLSSGPFLEMCEAAAEDPERYYVLVIDEINRGDPARIFGELLYTLEYRDEPVDLALGGQLTVPKNLVVLGTMNSVDRSVALVDYALRRRFGFVRISPDPDLVSELRADEPGAVLAAKVLHYMNEWLADQLDIEHTLGHSFFLNRAVPLHSEEDLAAIWALDIKPLLEEYFFGDSERLRSAEAKWKQSLATARADSEEEAGAEPLEEPSGEESGE